MPAIRLSKGALVRLEGSNDAARAIVFQYNPESLRHSLQAAALSSAPGAPTVPAGAPTDAVSETFSFTLVLDAADALAAGDASAGQIGVHPLLSALELLLREDAQPLVNAATVFVWGKHRMLPVRLVRLDVHERLFDSGLNPLHATVHVTLQAMDGTEPGAASLVQALFAQHQEMLKALARTAYSTSVQAQADSPGV